jgi:hypothetical protein
MLSGGARKVDLSPYLKVAIILAALVFSFGAYEPVAPDIRLCRFYPARNGPAEAVVITSQNLESSAE